MTREFSRLEMAEGFASRRVRSRKKLEQWHGQLQQDSSLHTRLVGNLFSPQNRKELQQHLGNTSGKDSYYDQARALVLAEPVGQYDICLQQQTTELRRALFTQRDPQQRQEIKRQLDDIFYTQLETSGHMVVRLEQWVDAHRHQLIEQPYSEESLYPALSRVAFGTKDLSAIQSQFSQEQRRDFRLAIVNFMQDLQGVQEFYTEAKQNPRRALRLARPKTGAVIFEADRRGDIVTGVKAMFGIQKRNVPYEVVLRPTGVGIILEAGAFREYTGSTAQGIRMDSSLQSLRQVVVVNGERNAITGRFSYDETFVAHEFRHVMFDSFFRQSPQPSERARKIFYAQERAKNEILAYRLSNNWSPDPQVQIQTDFSGLGYWLGDNPKRLASHTRYLQKTREYQYLVMQVQKRAALGDPSFTPQFAEALLYLLPFEKADRLIRYVGISPEDLPSGIAKEGKIVAGRFDQVMEELWASPLGKELSIEEWIKINQTDIMGFYPKEALPTVVKLLRYSGDNQDIPAIGFRLASLLYGLYGNPASAAFEKERFSPEEIQQLEDAMAVFADNRVAHH